MSKFNAEVKNLEIPEQKDEEQANETVPEDVQSETKKGVVIFGRRFTSEKVEKAPKEEKKPKEKLSKKKIVGIAAGGLVVAGAVAKGVLDIVGSRAANQCDDQSCDDTELVQLTSAEVMDAESGDGQEDPAES